MKNELTGYEYFLNQLWMMMYVFTANVLSHGMGKASLRQSPQIKTGHFDLISLKA